VITEVPGPAGAHVSCAAAERRLTRGALLDWMRSALESGLDAEGIASLFYSTLRELAPVHTDALNGFAQLSGRERQVVELIAMGRTHQQIARALNLSPHTVDTYAKRVRAKVGLGNKADLTRMAVLFRLRSCPCRKSHPGWSAS
jgi:DNA-binding CsgD family transcriptional regulator